MRAWFQEIRFDDQVTSDFHDSNDEDPEALSLATLDNVDSFSDLRDLKRRYFLKRFLRRKRHRNGELKRRFNNPNRSGK